MAKLVREYHTKKRLKALEHYQNSGVLAVIFELRQKEYSQEEIARFLAENGYENAGGETSWSQVTVSKVIARAKQHGIWPE